MTMNFSEIQKEAFATIERVAYKHAARSFYRRGQQAADQTYFAAKKHGEMLWEKLLSKNSASDALFSLQKDFAHEIDFEPSTAPKTAKKRVLKPGPELFCLGQRFDYDDIMEKFHEGTDSNLCTKKKEMALKTAKEKADIYLANAFFVYRETRHAKFLPLSEYENMLQNLRKIANY